VMCPSLVKKCTGPVGCPWKGREKRDIHVIQKEFVSEMTRRFLPCDGSCGVSGPHQH